MRRNSPKTSEMVENVRNYPWKFQAQKNSRIWACLGSFWAKSIFSSLGHGSDFIFRYEKSSGNSGLEIPRILWFSCCYETISENFRIFHLFQEFLSSSTLMSAYCTVWLYEILLTTKSGYHPSSTSLRGKGVKKLFSLVLTYI